MIISIEAINECKEILKMNAMLGVRMTHNGKIYIITENKDGQLRLSSWNGTSLSVKPIAENMIEIRVENESK
jgi:hypothetical protein